jgi:hypothetical protein
MPGTRLSLIMRKPTTYGSTSALPAIAAALALSSTPLLAQQAQPATTDPTPPVATQPAPSDAPAASTDSTPTAATTAESTVDTSAPATKVKHAVRTAAKPVPVTTKTASRTTATRVVHASAPAVATRVAAVPATAPAAAPAKPARIVDLSAKADAPPVPPARHASADRSAQNAEMVGGGALALLALGGGAYALSRRRRREDEVVYEDAYEPETQVLTDDGSISGHDPIFEEQPAIVAPSAFAWGNHEPVKQQLDDGADRQSGETWVERAYRGPSPANPSVSLRNRLKRAAFFDKRERDVAEGKAEPVDADAGLPEAAVEEQATQHEREFA